MGNNPDPLGGVDYTTNGYIFRWKLVRQFEAFPSGGSPANIVRYQWRHDTTTPHYDVSRLTDIFYTPAIGAPPDAPNDGFANHVYFAYERSRAKRTRFKLVDVPTWLREPDYVVTGIDVASRAFGSAREQVRRYHLTYGYETLDRPYLTNILLEGRCTPNAAEFSHSDGSFTVVSLPPNTNCPTYQPGTTYHYAPSGHVESGGYVGAVTGAIALLPGPGGFLASPKLNGRSAALLDINRDGRADLVSASSPGGARIFINGGEGTFGWHVDFSTPFVSNLSGGLGDTTGLSVPGIWNDRWGASWLHRGVGAPNPSDGSPKTLYDITGWSGWQVNTWTGVGMTPPSLPPPHAYADIDGDGTTDMLYLDETGASPAPTKVRFSRRTLTAGTPGFATGTVTPFSELPPVGPYPAQTNLRLRTGSPPRAAFLADMNGDGIVDYVTNRRNDGSADDWVYIPGRGDGRFGCTDPTASCTAAMASPGYNDATPAASLTEVGIYGSDSNGVREPLPAPVGSSPTEKRSLPHLTFHDVTGDGKADLIYVSKKSLTPGDPEKLYLDVWVNRDSGLDLRRVTWEMPDTLYLHDALDPLVDETRLLFGDIDGNGIDDVVLCGDDDCQFVSMEGAKPGLLTSIEHEGGATTEFEYYKGLADLEATQAASNPWPEDGAWRNHAPVAIWPVRRITNSNNAPGAYARTSYQELDYRDPMFDRWRRAFRGFRRTRVTTGRLVVDSQFYFGGCLEDDQLAQVTGGCVDPEKGSKGGYAWETLNGQPSVIMKYDSYTGVCHSTLINTYAVQPSDTGVAFAYVSSATTLLYDTSVFSAAPSDVGTPFQTPYLATLCAPAADAVKVRRSQVYDLAGNLTQAIDAGHIANNGTPVDRPISTTFEWSTTDASWPAAVSALGREYRLKSAETKYLTGGSGSLLTAASGLDGAPRKLGHSYDSLGRLTTTSATLAGSLKLDRFHEAGFGMGPEPAGAIDGLILLSTLGYDAFGNVNTRKGTSAGECQTIDYDPTFGDLPVASHVWVGINCGGTDLKTTTSYDRGLGTVRQRAGLNNETQRVDTDAFGRPSVAWGPGVSGGLVRETTFLYSPTNEPVHWVHAIRESTDPTQSGASRVFSDSTGSTLTTLTQADPGGGDAGDWVAHTAPLLSARGEPIVWHEPVFHTGGPELFSVGYSFGPEQATATYDFMSRRLDSTRSSDGHTVESRQYHPLSTVVWDGENLYSFGPHFDRHATITTDGHGRQMQVTKLTESGQIDTRTDYLATGEVAAIERGSGAATGRYRRWMKYDSLGRMVENAEPNSVVNFADLPAGTSNLKAWRYRYDNAGRLVGTRDARGCGKNLFYDLASRLIAEDFSPCLNSQEGWSGPPDLATGNSTEVFYRYDTPEPGQTTDYGNGLFLKGKLISIRDRGAHTRFAYDGRGRTTGVARRVAKPPQGVPVPITPTLLSSRYTAHWFRTASAFDDRDRLQRFDTGADVPELQQSGASHIDYHYSPRNVVSRIDGSYGPLVLDQRFNADGRPDTKTLGDVGLTQMSFHYRTSDRRLGNYTLHQVDTPHDAARDLINHTFDYDEVGNITSILDNRDESRWPGGAKPVSRIATYDSLYRATNISYSHQSDGYVSPFEAEETASNALPLPRVTPSTGRRIEGQSYAYDALGNVTAANDDAATSFDRGLGTVTTGDLTAASEASRKPNQLLLANGPTPAGAVRAHYDAAGNLTDFELERDGTCSAPTGKCLQRMLYEWDEVGQLTRARRWDYSSSTGQPLYPDPPVGAVAAELRYQYSAGQRVIKQSVDPSSSPRFAVDVFDSVRLNHAQYVTATNDFERTSATETVYLPGLGRVVYAPGLPTAGSDQHVFLNFGDHLGSSTAIVDKDTGQLVEYTTYQAYGAVDSDYRPAEWQSFREDVKFTGKEEDVEVGLQYFGARYYSPYLARFVSPDPLTVHALGSDLNPYAYVGGHVFNATDPNGLCSGFFNCISEGINTVFGGRSDDGPSHDPQASGGEGQGGYKECTGGDNQCFGGGRGAGGSSHPAEAGPAAPHPATPPGPSWVATGWQSRLPSLSSFGEIYINWDRVVDPNGAGHALIRDAHTAINPDASMAEREWAVAMIALTLDPLTAPEATLEREAVSASLAADGAAGAGATGGTRLVVGAGAARRMPGMAMAGDVTLDIDPGVRPDIVANFSKPLSPVPGAPYDAVLFERYPSFGLNADAAANAHGALRQGGAVEVLTGAGTSPMATIQHVQGLLRGAGFCGVTGARCGPGLVQIRGTK